MDNKAELKEYIFAHYIGQKVCLYQDLTLRPRHSRVNHFNSHKFTDAVLLLKPLHLITLEDALPIIKIFSGWNDTDTKYIRYKVNRWNEKFAQVYTIYENENNKESVIGNFCEDGTFHSLHTNRSETSLFAHLCAIQMGYATPMYFKGTTYTVIELVGMGIYEITK